MNITPLPTPAHDAIRVPLSPRVPLVKLDTVIAASGKHDYNINGHVNSGTFRWVFNMAPNPRGANRDLRFWNREVSVFANGQVSAHAALRRAGADDVVEQILGQNAEFQSGEVCLLLNVRRNALTTLRREMGHAGGETFQRRELEELLKRRLLHQ